jgi:uncharacterized membrane protein
MEIRMPSRPDTVMRFFLVFLAVAALAAGAAEPGNSAPEVRALLFYDPGTTQSRDFFAFYLPGLTERWGPRLQIAGVDTSRPAGAAVYSAGASRWALPPAKDGTPVVLVGDRALVGLPQIAKGLGDDVEGLAGDPLAANWPSVPGLDALLPEAIQAIGARVARQGAPQAKETPRLGDAPSTAHSGAARDSIANTLAVVVLIGMVAAFVHALIRLRHRRARPGIQAVWLLPVALLAGLGISGYTAYTALAQIPLACGPIGSCADVQASEYAKIFGVPLGVLGIVGYLLILVAWLLARRRSPRSRNWYWAAWAIALFGVLFSLRLTALEPFVIGATCVWCLGSAICMTLVFWLLSGLAGTKDPAGTPLSGTSTR